MAGTTTQIGILGNLEDSPHGGHMASYAESAKELNDPCQDVAH